MKQGASHKAGPNPGYLGVEEETQGSTTLPIPSDENVVDVKELNKFQNLDHSQLFTELSPGQALDFSRFVLFEK